MKEASICRRKRASAHLGWALLLPLLLPVTAQAQNVGFQLNRYEPTTVGEWSFMVDHPWYTKTRDFAAGLTLNYAHNPLVFGLRNEAGDFTKQETVIQHHLLFHVDMGVALFDRLNVSLTLPVTALERGMPVGGVIPRDTGAMGDPRIGLMVRLYGQPDASAFSLSLGGSLWIPVNATEQRAGDAGVRVLPRLVAAGLWKRLRYSATAGYYHRPEASVAPNLSDPRGGEIGPAFQFGALVQYADLERRFAVGPELQMNTTVTGGHAFKKDYTNLELLLGAHYNIASQVQVGLAAGIGTLRDPGTPDFRLLFRLAYAPLRKPEAKPAQAEPAKPCPVCPTCVAPPPPPPVLPPPPPPVVSTPDKPCLLPLLYPIHFDTDKDDPENVKNAWMRRRNLDVLHDMAKQLQSNPDVKKVRVGGHTDNRGKPEYNKDLSQRRAESIRRWLVDPSRGGISEGRLSAEGFGLERPVASNASPDGREKNRRVEFEILEASKGCPTPQKSPAE